MRDVDKQSREAPSPGIELREASPGVFVRKRASEMF